MNDWTVNHYIKAWWRWLWLILAVTIMAGAAGFAASTLMKPVYRAQSTVMTGEDNTNPQVKTEDWVLSQRLATGYAALAKRQPILQAAVQALRLQTDWRTVQENVLVAPVSNTNLLEIRVADTDPHRAAALANEIARQLVIQSPTAADLQQLNQRQTFTQTQLDALQSNIQSAEADLNAKQAAVDSETSARAVMDLKDSIKADETKIADWRAEYGKLLANMPTRSASTITVVETAVPPTTPVSPIVWLNIALGAVAGMLLSFGAVFLVEYLGADKVRSQADTAVLPHHVRALASIAIGKPSSTAAGPESLLVQDVNAPITEDFRLLRTNLRFAAGLAEPMTILVTSPGVGEGKSTVSANLAASFARAGKQTILIDADLRHPTLHAQFGIDDDEDGLTALLYEHEGEHELSRWLPSWLELVLHETGIPNLRLLTAGRRVNINPGELLASRQLAPLLEALRNVADVLIIDTPPALPVADASIIAGHQDVGVLLVAATGRTTTKALELTCDAFGQGKARIVGVVINKASSGSKQAYPYLNGGDGRESRPRQVVGAQTGE